MHATIPGMRCPVVVGRDEELAALRPPYGYVMPDLTRHMRHELRERHDEGAIWAALRRSRLHSLAVIALGRRVDEVDAGQPGNWAVV